MSIPLHLYHVSCDHNNESIMSLGLVPNTYIGYEETPSEYIYLALDQPSGKISSMKDDNKNLLDFYMLGRAHEYQSCKQFNLYEINTTDLNRYLFYKKDKRELLYKGVIPPDNIRLIKHYTTIKLDRQYRTLKNI